MKVKVNIETTTLEIVSSITVKEFIKLVKTIDVSKFIIVPSQTQSLLHEIDSENNNLKFLKNNCNMTNKAIAKKLGISERTVYRKLKEFENAKENL